MKMADLRKMRWLDFLALFGEKDPKGIIGYLFDVRRKGGGFVSYTARPAKRGDGLVIHRTRPTAEDAFMFEEGYGVDA